MRLKLGTGEELLILICSSELSLSNMQANEKAAPPSPSSPSGDYDNLPKGLITWRDAVVKANTAAQLAMTFYMLEASIAWDKSIMKAVSPSANLSVGIAAF
jgi:hypothetical protein